MMNVSEITTDDLIVIARSGHSASFEMIEALALAELDRRGKAEVVKYWRGDGCYKGMFVVTKNNVVASVNIDRYQLWVGQSWDERISDWHEISRAVYEAAKQPKPAERPEIEPLPDISPRSYEDMPLEWICKKIDELIKAVNAVERRGK
jgi:hypothetical protein